MSTLSPSHMLVSAAVCAFVLAGAPAHAQRIEAPRGALVARNIDLAAEQAIEQWIEQLKRAPHTDQVRNIGILQLREDAHDFTSLLAQKLTALDRFNVVILSGRDWDVIEDEMARQDPDAGWGDIMDKASIKWVDMRSHYALPETALGADALLLGQVRSIDADWYRARVRLTLYLARVDTRSQVAGGIAEGESTLTARDLVIYYKTQIIWGILIFVGVLIVLWLFRCILRSMTRPR